MPYTRAIRAFPTRQPGSSSHPTPAAVQRRMMRVQSLLLRRQGAGPACFTPPFFFPPISLSTTSPGFVLHDSPQGSSPICGPRFQPASAQQPPSWLPSPMAIRTNESKLPRSWCTTIPQAAPRRPRHGGRGKNARNDTNRIESPRRAPTPGSRGPRPRASRGGGRARPAAPEGPRAPRPGRAR